MLRDVEDLICKYCKWRGWAVAKEALEDCQQSRKLSASFHDVLDAKHVKVDQTCQRMFRNVSYYIGLIVYKSLSKVAEANGVADPPKVRSRLASFAEDLLFFQRWPD